MFQIGSSSGSSGTSGLNSLDASQQSGGGSSIGSGVAAGDGAALDGVSSYSFSAVTASLSKYFASQTSDDAEQALLAEVLDKIKQTLTGTDENRINIESAQKEEALAEQKKEIDDAAKKQAQAAAKAKKTKIWNEIKTAFQMLAALVSIAVGAVLCITGAGVALGGVMIAAGIVGVISGVNSAVQLATGNGILGDIAKAAGGNSKTIKALDTFMAVDLAIVGAVLGVAMFFASLPADVASIAEIASSVSQGVNGATQVATGAGDIGADVVNYQATELNATAKDDRAKSDQLEGVMSEIDATISMIIKNMSDIYQGFDKVMNSTMDAVNDVNKTLTQAQFVG